ncbi:protein kinase [Maioricimonas sp. JC845]|uniref:protein kinase domain-containing protein n=1 Tax=Maioricimonas sp. JC845 TaxID=3232138 RepID=UPI00345A5D0E
MATPSECPVCGSHLPLDATAGLCPKCLLQAGMESDPPPGESPFAPTTPQSGGFVPPSPSVLATAFPGLDVLELIGHGGMGAVYKARQKKLDRLVALKIIRPESAVDPAFAERFTREAMTLARLNHPHIVAIHDFGEVDYDPGTGNAAGESGRQPLFYFVMEYVDGANVHDLIRQGQVPPQQALAIIAQICEALQYAHDEGIVHRDIKPENVLVDRRGRVKIADFGLARLIASSPENFTLTATHQVMGTPRYMAPEQMAGSHHVDHRADLYALGVVMYEMLTGELPIGRFEPPSRKVPVDTRLDEVVHRALASDPQQRYQQASQIRSDVERLVHENASSLESGESGAITPVPPPGPSTILENHVAQAVGWLQGGKVAPLQHGNEPEPEDVHTDGHARGGFGRVLATGIVALLVPIAAVGLFTKGSGAAGENAPVPVTGPVRMAVIGLCIVVATAVFMATLKAWWFRTTARKRRRKPAVRPREDDITPRFSRKAIFGAVWGMTFIFVCLILLPAVSYRGLQESGVGPVAPAASHDGGEAHADGGHHLPSRELTFGAFAFIAVMALIGIASLTSPFGMTILGVAAISEIRHSKGRITGLGLAYFDAVFFPLIVFSIVFFWGFVQLIGGGIDTDGPFSPDSFFRRDAVRAAIVICLVVDIVLVWYGWQAASRPPGTVAAESGSNITPTGGAPFARVVLSVAPTHHLGSIIVAHFTELGYRLVEEQPTEWVFQRGRKSAALHATDIRRYFTQLNVRTMPLGPDRIRLSCSWFVWLFGAITVRRDAQVLEAEGRELESLINESAAASSGDIAAPSPVDASLGTSHESARDD